MMHKEKNFFLYLCVIMRDCNEFRTNLERMMMTFCRDSKLKIDLLFHTSQLYEMYIATNFAIKGIVFLLW